MVVYVGVEVFDILIYLGQILSKLGRKVLVIDHSETKLLSSSIPSPIDISCTENLVHYHNIDFTCLPLNKEMKEKYEDILIASGFNEAYKDISKSTRLVYVTDLYRHNSWRLGSLGYGNILGKYTQRELLIKSRNDVTIEPLVIAKIIDQNILKEDTSILFNEDKDERKRLIGHHNMSFYLRGISKNMRIYLRNEVGKYVPNIEKQDLKKAMSPRAYKHGKGEGY